MEEGVKMEEVTTVGGLLIGRLPKSALGMGNSTSGLI